MRISEGLERCAKELSNCFQTDIFQSFQSCILTEGNPPERAQTMMIVDEKNQGRLGARPAVGLLYCPQFDFSSLQHLDMSLYLCQVCC